MTTVQAAFSARVMSEYAAVPAWPTVTGLPGSPPVLIEDREAAHQIVIPCVQGRLIAVTCTCCRVMRGDARELILDPRDVIPAPIAIAAWRAWHTRRGISV